MPLSLGNVAQRTGSLHFFIQGKQAQSFETTDQETGNRHFWEVSGIFTLKNWANKLVFFGTGFYIPWGQNFIYSIKYSKNK